MLPIGLLIPLDYAGCLRHLAVFLSPSPFPMNDALRQPKYSHPAGSLMLAWALLGCTLIFAFADVASGQETPEIERLSVGFDGKIVLGKWVPFTVKLSEQTATENTTLRIETLDGDAVPIRYDQPPELSDAENGSQSLHGLVRVGRATGMTVSLLEAGGDQLTSRRFSLDELRESHTFLPGTARLSLFPFWNPGAASVEGTDLLPELDRQISDATAVVTNPRLLPEYWIGYESVRTMIITPGKFDTPLNKKQQAAIERWVYLGGRLIITGGPGYDAPFQTQVLGNLSPGTLQGTVAISDTGSIEVFTQVNEQLVQTGGRELTVTVIEPKDGHTVAGKAGEHPLFIHWIHGFGNVSFISLDLTAEPVLSWSGRKNLLTRALSPTGIKIESGDSELSGGRMSHIGFSDIVGQLRAGMDQFRQVSFITFTLVALLVALFILAIGPGDFFFLKRVVGKMEMTWITFILICVGFSLLAWILATRLKSPDTQVNQVEFVDVDAATGLVRGNLWAHVYSPSTRTYDIQLPAKNELFGAIEDGWLSWQGLPGRGLGSMQSRTDLGLYRKPYFSPINAEGSSLQAIPMQNASTKAFHATWYGELESPLKNGLRKSTNSDALLGTFTNPLDKPLYDFVVLYGPWVYHLKDRPLGPGETIVLEDDLREKTIAGYYTRKNNRGEEEVSAAWDSRGTQLPRIAQMMSFFELIGGESYTQLSNNYHAPIDLSQNLKMGRAVMMGQIRDTTTPLKINGTAFDQYDKRLTLLRIVLPVQPRK